MTKSEGKRKYKEYDALLPADSLATVHVQRGGRGRDTTRRLGDRPPTVPPTTVGLRAASPEPGLMSGTRPPASVVSLRMTGQCHSPGQSLQ